jgi:hypothetical protein
VDLYKAHEDAKSTIYVLESIDAATKFMDAVIYHRGRLERRDDNRWELTHNALLYRRELFQAAKLRTLSTNQRLQDALNLVSVPSPSCLGNQSHFANG